MDDKIKKLIEFVENRIKETTDELQKANPSSLDAIPEAIFIMKEQEAAKLRAVIQEQQNILGVINLLNKVA